MSRTNNRDNAEKLANVIDKLRDNIIIVEGKKDKRALYNLGLRNIIAINGKTLADVVNETLAKKKGSSVVILTDFDREGRKLAAKLRILLQRLKMHPNMRLRRMLMSFGKSKIEDFNAGNNFSADLIRGDYHVKVSTNINKVHNQSSHKSKGGRGKT